MLKVKRLHKDAKIPERNNYSDAGLDLAASEAVTIPSCYSGKVSTGLAMEIPTGFVGLIWPRSKLSTRFNCDILAGVIDSGYRGEVKVAIINHGKDDLVIEKGDKVAQLLLQRISLCQVKEVDELSESERGSAGIDDKELRLK